MNISIAWLSEYLDLPSTQEALEDVLNGAGLTVEGTQCHGADFPQVVVAQILESTQHPNADRLSVCKVDDGSGQPRQIVCGAKNYQIGDKVPLALPGAVLPGDFKIKTGKLRGVESEGMMCSAKELNLPGDASGLLILPASSQVGAPISSLFPADSMLELEVTPNRPDCLSHLGIAREISAFTGATLRPPQVSIPSQSIESAFTAEAASLCPFYSLRSFSGVKVSASPAWLSSRLESIGLRSINNVVDITNFVMMELGQPLHAFDADKIRGAVRVRLATDGEEFLALDGRSYQLQAHDIVIADDSGPIALAGVMGGQHSGVTESTTRVLLESAVFDPAAVRRTARRLDLHSDSSYRFERGIDLEMILPASARAAELIQTPAGGSADTTIAVSGPVPKTERTISLRTERCNSVLGVSLSDGEIQSALQSFGLQSVGENQWLIPSHRLDLLREVDLIEEIARSVGISRVPSRLVFSPSPVSLADRVFAFSMRLRASLAGLGFAEARTSTLISSAMSENSPSAVRLKNPLGEDQAMLRPALTPALLQSLSRNLRFGEKIIRLFEIGKVFHENGETLTLGLVASGPLHAPHWQQVTEPAIDFFAVKGMLESVLPITFCAGEPTPDHIVRAEIRVDGKPAGWLAQLSPQACRTLSAAHPVFAAEISLLPVLDRQETRTSYSPIFEFPATARDIAIVAPLGLPYETVKSEILAAKESLLVEVCPLNVFHDPSGEKLPMDSKSLAISLTFRSSERTLQTEEVNAATDRIKDRLRSVLAVGFRE